MNKETGIVRSMKLHKHFKKINFNKLCKLIRQIQQLEIDYQVIDFKAIDSELTYDAVVEAINEMYGLNLNGIDDNNITKDDLDKIEQQASEARRDFDTHIKEEFSKSIEQIKTTEPKIEKYFKNLKGYINTVVKSDIHGLVIYGEGGLSKSFTCLQSFNELGLKLGKDYELVSGFITPLSLYMHAYHNQNKILLLDDVDTLLDDVKNISILKALLWSVTGKRFVSYQTTSEKLTVPERFQFTGKVIIILNEVPNSDRKLQALFSRALKYKVGFTYTDKIKLLYEISKLEYKGTTQEDRREVADYIKEITSETSKELNIRTLIKGFEIRKHNENNWQELIKELIVVDENLVLVKEALEKTATVKEAIIYFIEHSGKSRATFFRHRKKLSQSLTRRGI